MLRAFFLKTSYSIGVKKRKEVFKKELRAWYKKPRQFAWRETTDPYAILVSEIMLQQTQVSRVSVKFGEFLSAFPTITALAEAPTSKVLQVWQGMGYNRRALMLKRAATEVTEKYKGVMPRDPHLLIDLPGIGQSTAGGIMSYAYNIPFPFIETNIRRVFIHHFFPRSKKVDDKDILKLVEKLIDQKNPRRWYTALMDYGTHLAQTIPNPNARSKHYNRQKPFKGSDREVRGAILKILGEKKALATLVFPKVQIEKNLENLVKEGFIVKKRKSYVLAE